MAAQKAKSVQDEGGEDINVSSLSEDRIKQLMKGDPKFISRLISQLDKSMHGMMKEKMKRLEQIKTDQEEVDRLDAMIKSHIKPNLDTLEENIKRKTELRDHLTKELSNQMTNLKKMERDAAALISNIRSVTSKLSKTSTSQRLEEARGFSTSVPTSTLLRSGKSSKS